MSKPPVPTGVLPLKKALVIAFFAMIFAIFALKSIVRDPWVDEPKAT